MKQILRFQSEQEFQSFFGQLSSAEIPDFQAVEGAGGDKGFDGISGRTAYQVYFPEEKNRSDINYITKIDTNVAKVLESKSALGLEIEHWTFVVPEDLRIEVVAHLQKKSKETGLNCTYWGATKLTELIVKHPHVQDSFPTIFLPPVRKGIGDIQDTLTAGQRPRVLTSVEIIGDDEYETRRHMITNEYHEKTRSFMRSHGTSSSAHIATDIAYKKEADAKLKELQIKKDTSDRAYALELDEINEYYDSEVERVNHEMSMRGLSASGIKDKALAKIDAQRKRAIERLKLKFGKKTGLVEE